MATHPPRLRLVSLAVQDTIMHPVAYLVPTLPKIIYITPTLTLTTHRHLILRTFLTFPCILHNLRLVMPIHTKSTPRIHSKLRILRHIVLLLLSLMQPISRVGFSSSRYLRYQNNYPCRPLLPCHPCHPPQNLLGF